MPDEWTRRVDRRPGSSPLHAEDPGATPGRPSPSLPEEPAVRARCRRRSRRRAPRRVRRAGRAAEPARGRRGPVVCARRRRPGGERSIARSCWGPATASATRTWRAWRLGEAIERRASARRTTDEEMPRFVFSEARRAPRRGRGPVRGGRRRLEEFRDELAAMHVEARRPGGRLPGGRDPPGRSARRAGRRPRPRSGRAAKRNLAAFFDEVARVLAAGGRD